MAVKQSKKRKGSENIVVPEKLKRSRNIKSLDVELKSNTEENDEQSSNISGPIESDGQAISEDHEEDETEITIIESSVESFSIKAFRESLSKPGAVSALKQFLRTPRDKVYEYLESGGNPLEIVRAIDQTDKKNTSDVTIIFEVLQIVLFEITAKSPQHISNAIETCRHLMNNYMGTIHTMLSINSQAKQRKAALKLLTSIVSLSSLLGRDVLSHLSLHTQILEMLTNHVNPSDKNSVRVCFIHFLMSFLVEGDLPLIRQLLSRKGILSSIIPGLLYDLPDTVNLVLTTIKTFILENINISKTLKIHTFNTFTAQNLVKLYDWKGPLNFVKSKLHKKGHNNSKRNANVEVDPVDKEIVQKSLHDFMLVLCTSQRYGIVFQDKTVGTSSKCYNMLLNAILKSIEKPWENEKRGDLVIAILRTSPDLIRNYISHLSPYIMPRNSNVWLSTVLFVRKLINGICPIRLMRLCEQLSLKQITSILCTFYMPICILKHFNKSLLDVKDLAVQHEVFLLLHAMLEQIKCSISFGCSTQSPKYMDMQQFKNYITEYLKQCFPSISDMLACWLCAYNVKGEDEPNDSKLDIQPPAIMKHIETVLNVLLLYHHCNPGSFENLHMEMDPTHVLEKIKILNTKSCKDDSMNSEAVCLRTLELLLHINPEIFLPDKDAFEDTFLLLLEKLTNDKDTMKQVKKILINLLHSTGMYDTNKNEIEVWLYAFKELNRNSQKIVTEFLCNVHINTYEHSARYFDKVAELRKLEDDSECSDTIKTEYDDIFGNIENSTPMQNNFEVNTIGISPVLMCSVDLLQRKEYSENSSIHTYISLVSLYLFHNQQSYRVIANILQSTGLPIVYQYIQYWISDVSAIPVNKVYKIKPFLSKLSIALLSDDIIEDFVQLLDLKETQTDEKGRSLGNLSDHSQSVEISCMFNMSIFYLSRLVQSSNLAEIVSKKIEKVCIALYDFSNELSCTQEENLDSVHSLSFQLLKSLFTNPVILLHFTPVAKEKMSVKMLVTNFLLNFVRHVKINSPTLFVANQQHLTQFRSKIIRELKNAITKPSHLQNDEVISLMEAMNVNFDDCLDLLSSLVDLEYTYFVSIENSMSNWCKVLTYIISSLCRLHTTSNNIVNLSINTCSKLAELYINLITKIDVEINFDLFEDSLHSFLIKFPYALPSFTSRFKQMLSCRRISKVTSKLIALCLERDWNQKQHFIEFAKNTENISKKEIIFSLLTAALIHNFDDCSVLKLVYDEHKSSIVKIIVKPYKAGHVYKDNYKMICYLINKYMDSSSCSPFTNKVLKFEICEVFHVAILNEVYSKMALSKPNDIKFVANYYIILVMFLNIILRQENIDYNKIHFVLNLITNWSELTKDYSYNRSNILKHPVWETFCKHALKNGLKMSKNQDDYYYSNGVLLKCLAKLCELFYENDNGEACILFQMSLSHSEFLNVMLNREDNEIKTNLLKLLWCLANKNPSVMQSAHVPVYLSAYHASLSLSDRIILALLHLYEYSGVSLYEYRPFLWGETAVNHYSVKTSTGNSLWRQPSMNEVLDLLEPEMVDETIRNFPVWRCLDATKQIYYHDDGDEISKNSSGDRLLEMYVNESILDFDKDDMRLRDVLQDEDALTTCDTNTKKGSEMYDPAFFLPLFTLLFAPEAVPATGKAAVSGATAMIWRAMGSSKEDTRGAACLALSRLRGHIDAQRNAKDKGLWLQLIDSVRNGLTQQKSEVTDEQITVPKISSISSLFLSRTSQVLTQPLNELYKPLSNYLLVKETIDLKTVPEMLLLLHSPNPEYKNHRIWILELLRDGIKSMLDFVVLVNSFAYKFIMDFYSCSLSDKDTKILILNIVNNSVKIPKAADILTTSHGLLPWLVGVLSSLTQLDHDLITGSIVIINNLRCSLTVNLISKSIATSEDKIILKSHYTLSNDINRFISGLIVLLLPKLSSRLNAKTIVKYLKACFHVMNEVVLFSRSDIENLIDVCEKIYRKDSGCHMLLKNGYAHDEPLKILIKSIKTTGLDQIVELGIRYLRLFVRHYMKLQHVND